MAGIVSGSLQKRLEDLFTAEPQQKPQVKQSKSRQRASGRPDFHTMSAKSAERSQELESMFEAGLSLKPSYPSLARLADAASAGFAERSSSMGGLQSTGSVASLAGALSSAPESNVCYSAIEGKSFMTVFSGLLLS